MYRAGARLTKASVDMRTADERGPRPIASEQTRAAQTPRSKHIAQFGLGRSTIQDWSNFSSIGCTGRR